MAYLYPWESPALEGWSIVGMNHYFVKGERFLFVAMVKGDKAIQSEGRPDVHVWNTLWAKAQEIDKTLLEMATSGKENHFARRNEELRKEIEDRKSEYIHLEKQWTDEFSDLKKKLEASEKRCEELDPKLANCSNCGESNQTRKHRRACRGR